MKGAKPKDRTGQVHGLLTAVRPTDGRVGSAIAWAWRCQCGAEVERPFNHTMAGSCGADACRKTKRKRHLTALDRVLIGRAAARAAAKAAA